VGLEIVVFDALAVCGDAGDGDETFVGSEEFCCWGKSGKMRRETTPQKMEMGRRFGRRISIWEAGCYVPYGIAD